MTFAVAEPTKGWQANPGGQWLFLACPYWEALADGDRGGGKSAALVASFLAHVGEGYGSGWRGVIFRRTYPELDDLIDRAREIIADIYPGVKPMKKPPEFEFQTGEKLMFRHLDSLKTYNSYHGHSIPFIGIDELTTWPDSEVYEAILSCSRPSKAMPNLPLMVRPTTNSWGVGHQWVKSRFVVGKKPFVPYGPPGRERILIKMQWAENLPFVAADPNYHDRLSDTITNPAQRAAWINNSWDIVAGGRFSDLYRESVHVLEPFTIPRTWRVDRSHDWGASHPYCTLWFAESSGEAIDDGRRWPKGTLFAIHEDYGCEGNMLDANWKPNIGLRLTPAEIAARTKDQERAMLNWGVVQKMPQPGPADDNIFDASRGRSIASQMSDSPNYLHWMKASKGPGSRIAGCQAIDARLKASLQHPMELPGLFIFESCQHLRRTLPMVPRDPKRPDDVDTTSEDHAVDALRYRLNAHTSVGVVHGLSL